MEQHAVPQDITGFKFKLVGDMTLKQFGELAFGAVMAYLFYASPWNALLKWPLVLFFGLFGIALAFFPVEERPLDIWIINFFKAIYKPTYYVWRRNSDGTAALQPAPKVTTRPIMESAAPPPQAPLVSEEPALWTAPVMPQQDNVLPPTPTVSPERDREKKAVSVEDLLKMRTQSEETNKNEGHLPNRQTPTIEDLLKMRGEKQNEQDTQSAGELSDSEKELADLTEKNKQFLMQIDEIRNKIYSGTAPNVEDLQKQLEKILAEKTKLNELMVKARDRAALARVKPITNASYQQPAIVKPAVHKEVKNLIQAVFSLTSVPNVINGLILNSAGTPINGAILVVKDKDNNSIRALRTNKAGQFIASTPLSDGTYYLDVEKEGYSFDSWEVALTGQVVMPIEIRAKEGE